MPYRIVWLREVFQDLDEIKAYLTELSPSASNRIMGEIAVALRGLAFMPEKNQRYLPAPEYDLRQKLVEDYIILYRIAKEKNLIEVVIVDHQSRDIPAYLQNRI